MSTKTIDITSNDHVRRIVNHMEAATAAAITNDEMRSAISSAADSARELATVLPEHALDLNTWADTLSGYASRVRSAPTSSECAICHGSREVSRECELCNGTGTVADGQVCNDIYDGCEGAGGHDLWCSECTDGYTSVVSAADMEEWRSDVMGVREVWDTPFLLDGLGRA